MTKTNHEVTRSDTKYSFVSFGVIVWIALLVSACSGDPTSNTTAPSSKPLTVKAQQSAQVFETTKYLLYLPADYAASEKRWPLLVYLHGGSLRGDDIQKVRSIGLASLLDKEFSIPFVVVSPLCPADRNWLDESDAVMRLVDNIASSYAIDQNRIYVTGHSLGGHGTWYLAHKQPEKFAAIVPLASVAPDEKWAKEIAKVPVWAFHGTKDELTPIAGTQRFVDTLKKLGADVKLTPLPDRDHSILDTYENKEIYDWLLQHSKLP